MADLVLGTVQLGMGYGVTNHQGAPTSDVVMAILDEFTCGGGCWLDTAPAYGRSEELIGKYLQQTDNRHHISTKSPHLGPEMSKEEMLHEMEASLQHSLQCLGVEMVDIYLLHQPWLLSHPLFEHLLVWMKRKQQDGFIRQIGASVYGPSDLENWEYRHSWLQWVQLPSNLFDQAAVRSGLIKALQARGIGVQARSLFLQGLLLRPTEAKLQLNDAQKRVLASLANRAKELNLSPLRLALAYARSLPVDQVVIGVNSVSELVEIKQQWERCEEEIDFSEFQVRDQYLINPSMWVE